MNNKIKVDTHNIDINKLKKFLKHGDLKRIAEKAGLSYNHVARTLNPNSDYSLDPNVVVAAVELVQNRVKVELDPDIATAILKNGQNSVLKSASD